MPPGSPSEPHSPSPRLRPLCWGAAVSLLALCLAPLPAWAQEGQAPGVAGADDPDNVGRAEQGLQGPVGEVPGEDTQATREIAFESDAVSYNSDTDTVTAEGNVILRSEDQSVRADAV